MGLKILHSADWHLDSPFSGVSEDQRLWLQEELGKVPGKIAALCRVEACDLVLLAGDLFDGPYTKETAKALYRALADCAVPVFIAPGNHDFLSPGSPWLAEPWPENVHIFGRGITSVALPELNCRIYGAGFDSMDSPALLEGFQAQGPERHQIGLFHGDPIKIHSHYNGVTAAQVRDSGLDYLAMGHVHRRGAFRAGNALCAWPGVPMGRGFDELRESGVYIVTLDNTAACRFVELDTPRFYSFEVTEEKLEELLPGAGNRHFYRITLIGEKKQPLQAIYDKLSCFPNLELTDHREDARDPWETAGEDTLEGTYFRILQEKLETAQGDYADQIRLAAQITRDLLDGKGVQLP